MLDRYLLRYFLAVVDQGSFSRAAGQCNVSQPTLSTGVAKLENILGKRVFVRSNQRVELTDAGASLVEHARRIEREYNALQQAMVVSHSHRPELRLGVLASVPGMLIASSLARTRPADQFRFELLFGSERELATRLAKGRIDLALTMVGRGADRFMEQPILTEGYALALSANHPLAGEQEIASDLLGGQPMIVRRHCEALSETSRFFTQRGVRPHFTFRSTNDERVLEMVAADLGVTVMPHCYQHPGVRRAMLTGFRVQRTLGWAAAHDVEHLITSPPPLLNDIANALRSVPVLATSD